MCIRDSYNYLNITALIIFNKILQPLYNNKQLRLSADAPKNMVSCKQQASGDVYKRQL